MNSSKNAQKRYGSAICRYCAWYNFINIYNRKRTYVQSTAGNARKNFIYLRCVDLEKSTPIFRYNGWLKSLVDFSLLTLIFLFRYHKSLNWFRVESSFYINRFSGALWTSLRWKSWRSIWNIMSEFRDLNQGKVTFHIWYFIKLAAYHNRSDNRKGVKKSDIFINCLSY